MKLTLAVISPLVVENHSMILWINYKGGRESPSSELSGRVTARRVIVIRAVSVRGPSSHYYLKQRSRQNELTAKGDKGIKRFKRIEI